MDDRDEEGNLLDEEDFDAGGPLFENKKLSFYIIDGGPSMFEDDDNKELPFTRAAKAIHQQILKVGCSTQRVPTHMVGVIVANTANSHPKDTLGVDRFFEFIPLDFVSAESAIAMGELAQSDDIKTLAKQKFGGFGEADLGSIIYYVKKASRIKTRSNRLVSVFYITNNTQPFGPKGMDTTQFRQARKNISDLRCNGEFTCLFIGDEWTEDSQLETWRALDPTVSCDSIEELESTVYHKSFAPRAHSILPFQIGPGVTLDVGLYTLAAEAKRPTATYVDAANEEKVESRTVYRVKEKKKEGEEEGNETTINGNGRGEDDEFAEKNGDVAGPSSSSSFAFRPSDRTRSELKQAIDLGGEKVVFTQEELAKLKTFDKGLVLLGFKPIEKLRVDRHVEAAKFIYPNEKSTKGSRLLFRSLLDRCSARGVCMVCYLNVSSNTRPRLVALLPSQDSPSASDGFHVVFLPMADDCNEGVELAREPREKMEETGEERSASEALVKKLTARFQPYENPQLQTFYSMLVEYATGEKSKTVEDTIKPYFANEKAVRRVQKELDGMTTVFGELSGGPAGKSTAAKRGASGGGAGRGEAGAKKAKELLDGSLREIARMGKLSSLTVADLKVKAGLEGIPIPSSIKKKEDLVEFITKQIPR